MPKPPSYIDKIQFATRVFSQSCQDPWTLYLETALEPAGNALLTLLGFGLDDVIRAYARPRGLRGGRHGRRGKRGGKPPKGLPEFGELIGKNLPGQKEFSQRQVSQGVKNLWIVDGLLQRALFWWLVIDVVIDFGYEWSTLIHEARMGSGCESGRVLTINDSTFASPPTPWVALGTGEVAYRHNFTVASFGVTPRLGGGTVVCGLEAFNPSATNTVALTLRARVPGVTNLIDYSPTEVLLPRQRRSLVATLDVKQDETVVAEVNANGGAISGSNYYSGYAFD